MSNQPLWSPSAERIESSSLHRFMQCLHARRELAFDNYAALHAWSLRQSDAFWFELAHFADVKADWADAPVLRHGERMPGAEWGSRIPTLGIFVTRTTYRTWLH